MNSAIRNHRFACQAHRFVLGAAVVPLLFGGTITDSQATEPCGDFGKCKVLIEINAFDGDIGFHFLMDADDLISTRIDDPDGTKVFEDKGFGPLREQKLTETFAESSEPLCWLDPSADPDDEIVTLEEFHERWQAGMYQFSGTSEGGDRLEGESELTYALPAAPADVEVQMNGNHVKVTWSEGDDLGNCASSSELVDLVADGTLPIHPDAVPVEAWEIALAPDVEDGDSTGDLVFSIRVAGNISPMEVTVPDEYLHSLPPDTPVKIEVGAIGVDDNATFTEAEGFCANEAQGCED